MPLDLSGFHFTDAFEVLLLTSAIYGILRFIRSTRGVGVLRGLFTFTIIALVSVALLDRFAPGGVAVIKFILEKVTPYFALIVVIIFQEEIRQGISRFGQSGLLRFGNNTAESPTELNKIVTTAKRLANLRTGALLAFERNISLKPFSDGAVSLDLPISPILLETIFFDGGPLHDGGVVVKGKRITAASCVFPLTNNPSIARRLGTRHRAAIGLSERTDAVVLIISEESGEIGIAADGVLHKPIGHDQLERRLSELLKTESKVAEAIQAGGSPEDVK
ncbi:MAG: diadenylate cyclase CdaA [Planctomycetota bacterium]|nr:diadenylate cyclase CdaA [Planctomycetota bacterium]MDA1113304.1 diadenylate cyclase CdaA [Planctomycetota bacterium]